MKLMKNPFIFLYLFAFIYLMMCPSAHQLGEIVPHGAILKIKVQLQQNNFNNDYTIDPLHSFNKSTTTDFYQIRKHAVIYIQSSLLPLSTVKLIL